MTYSRPHRHSIPSGYYPIQTLEEFRILSASIVGTSGGLAANTIYSRPFALPSDQTVTAVRVNCTAGNAAGRNIDLGFHDLSSNVLVASMGSTLCAAGVNTWVPNFVLEAGRMYYISMVGNNANLAFWRAAPGTNLLRQFGVVNHNASTFPLPNPLIPVQVTTTFFPIISMDFV